MMIEMWSSFSPCCETKIAPHQQTVTVTHHRRDRALVVMAVMFGVVVTY